MPRGCGESRASARGATASISSAAIANRTARKSSTGTRSSRSWIRKNVEPQLAVTASSAASRAGSARRRSCRVIRRPGASRSFFEQRDVRVVGARREPGRLQDERHSRRWPGGRSSSSKAPVPMWPSPIFWCRSLNAPRDVHRVVGVHQPQPSGSADLHDPVHAWRWCRPARRAARRRRRRGRCPGRCRPWGGGRGRRGSAARSSTPAHSDRPWPAVGSSSSHGAVVGGERVQQRQQALAHLPHRGGVPGLSAAPPRGRRTTRCARPRPPRRSRPPGAGCAPHGHRLLVGRGRGGAEVHQVGRVDEDPDAPLGGRVAERRVVRRVAGASAPSRGGCRRRPGWSRSPSSSAVASAPATRPLPTGTWVPMGLRRAGSRLTTEA